MRHLILALVCLVALASFASATETEITLLTSQQLSSGASVETGTINSWALDEQVLYIRWINNFTDSLVVSVRAHLTDSGEAYPFDLDPCNVAHVDSVIAKIADTDGTGGLVAIPIMNALGTKVWSRYLSFRITKQGTGNVLGLESEFRGRGSNDY